MQLKIGFIGIEDSLKSSLSLNHLLSCGQTISYVISDSGNYQRRFINKFNGMKSLSKLCREYGVPHHVIDVKKKKERNLQHFPKKK